MTGLRGTKVVFWLMAALAGATLAAPAWAEDLKSRWYFGANLGYLSTTDDIRNNAAIIFTNKYGDDGIPFTGDPNELQGCDPRGSGGFSSDPYCDPRPDDLLSRETTIEETFRYDITVGYGITSWLSVQLDASYFKGVVEPIDAFIRESYPIAGNPANPTALTLFKDRDQTIPVVAGDIKEIPVAVTAIIRFRKDSPLNPYIGAGVGMIFAELDVSNDVGKLNDRLNRLRIRGVGNEYGRNITPAALAFLGGEGRIPNRWPVSVDVDDALEWHLTGGVEYFFNDRWSVVFDARYLFADQAIEINLGGEDQVDFIAFSEELFRPDGSVKIFNTSGTGAAPNPTCAEAFARALPGQTPVGCSADPNTWATTHVNPAAPGSGILCPSVGDFDKDGQIDQCYSGQIAASASGARTPDALVVVQGGKIDLTGFSVAVGMRFHF